MKADAIGLLMFIDTIIYRLVDYVYDIFNALAKVNIFDMNDYKNICYFRNDNVIFFSIFIT